MQGSDKIAWNPIPQKPVEAIDSVEKKQAGDAVARPADSQFRNLLESIERLRIEGKKLGDQQDPGKGGDAEVLDEAMDLADRTHENAMDMRRKLEEAFRRHVTG